LELEFGTEGKLEITSGKKNGAKFLLTIPITKISNDRKKENS
jgi:hypothetical protein